MQKVWLLNCGIFKTKVFYALCILISCVLVSLLLEACGKDNKNKKNITTDTDCNYENSQIKITFLDVLKGDCILIQGQEKTYLIDTGYKETASYVVEYLRKQNVSKIDGLILTHFDKDHLGGAADIIKAFDILKIYQPDYVESNDEYEKYQKAIKKNNLKSKVQVVKEILNIEGEIHLTIYPPNENQYKDVNNYSLVTMLTNGVNKVLFPGDAVNKRINELLKLDDISAELLKIPHHGNIEKNSPDFIYAVHPKYAIITCDSVNDVDDELKNILSDLDIKTYYTCNGEVTCISDGVNEISVCQ